MSDLKNKINYCLEINCFNHDEQISKAEINN